MILYIILFVLLFLVFFLQSPNPYKLIMLFGKKGSGKTSLIAKLSLKYIRKGYKVYSNVPIAGTFLYQPDQIGLSTFPPGSVVFCDEVGLIWNNRDYKNFKRCVTEFFKFQRQYKIRMYLFSQAFDIDKVLRDLTDQMYLIKRFGKLSIARPVNKVVGISTDLEGNGTFVDSYRYGSIFNWVITYLPRYYGLFDSFNPPTLPEIDATFQDFNDVSKIYADSRLWVLLQLRRTYTKILERVRSWVKR